MHYPNMVSGIFVKRPNRFIAHIDIEGTIEICHVKNTGRCAELLIPGTRVYVQKSDNPNRKTKYSLIAVEKGQRLIHMDSQAPNHIFAEWIKESQHIPDIVKIIPEFTYHDSRLDFYIATKTKEYLVEVKGVTLEKDNVAMFPDAPTLRGVRHIETLLHAKEAGYSPLLVFIIQMEQISYFMPNDQMHPAFGDAMRRAAAQDVQIIALDCTVTPDSITAAHFVPILLDAASSKIEER